MVKCPKTGLIASRQVPPVAAMRSFRRLKLAQGMMILFECHPFLPFTKKFSYGSDLLNYRKAIAYEVILRLLGHCRSLVANTNIYNHIGTGVSLRCMLELYSFLVFLNNGEADDFNQLDKLLHGCPFFSGEWYEYEKSWARQHGSPIPDDIKDLLKSLLKTPPLSRYRDALKSSDRGFEHLYAVYSHFVHPTFGRPRDQFMEDSGHSPTGMVMDDSQYYILARNSRSPLGSLKRDLDTGSFCLELTWPEVLKIDPLFNKQKRKEVLRKLESNGALINGSLNIS